MGWDVNAMSQSLYLQEAGWASGLVWTREENLAITGIRTLDRPARSESPYRLSYRGPQGIMFTVSKMYSLSPHACSKPPPHLVLLRLIVQYQNIRWTVCCHQASHCVSTPPPFNSSVYCVQVFFLAPFSQKIPNICSLITRQHVWQP